MSKNLSKYSNTVKGLMSTRPAYLLVAMMSLVGVYVFGLLAVDSGSYWHYLLALGSIVLFAKNLKLLVTGRS